MSTPVFQSPCGPISIQSTNRGVYSVRFVDEPCDESFYTQQCRTQLEEYFSGIRDSFSVPLDLNGTPFQLSVWDALMKVLHGSTCSYLDIACAVGRPQAPRAVANAIGANPLLILVPCHRVIRSGGEIGGYSAGAKKKQWLLEFERATARV